MLGSVQWLQPYSPCELVSEFYGKKGIRMKVQIVFLCPKISIRFCWIETCMQISLLYDQSNMGSKEILPKAFFWKEVNNVCTPSLALLFGLATLKDISYQTTSKDCPGGLH